MGAWDWVEDRAGDAVNAYGAAMDWALPGDGVVERAESFVDGRSPVSPLAPFRDMAEASVEAAPEAADQMAEEFVPGYDGLRAAGGKVDEVVGHVPGGYAGAGLALLILLVVLLARPAARTGKNVARGAARTYAPTAYALAHGRPAPRARGRHAAAPRSSGAARPKGRHTGRPGRADVVATAGRRLEVCADTEREALRTARRRWQGWDVRPVRSWVCDVAPAKVHVDIRKERQS